MPRLAVLGKLFAHLNGANKPAAEADSDPRNRAVESGHTDFDPLGVKLNHEQH